MDIANHPIWKNVSPFKKPLHLLRIKLATTLAKLYPRSTFIGITGSVGKTTTTICCLEVLSQKFNTLATTESKLVNLDPIFNIPITLLKLRPKTEKMILEMGVEYKGDMDINLSMVAPATGIITRVYFAHSQFLGGIDEVSQEKAKLIQQLPEDGITILNWDDIYSRKLADQSKAQIIFYGTDPKRCDIWAGNIRLEDVHTRFELNYGVERVNIDFKLIGKHQVYPALAAAALGISCGLSLISIKRGLEKVESAPHRLQLLSGINGATILDDTYNSSPAAVLEAVNLLKDLSAKRRIVVLGEMKELGQFSPQLHKKIGQKLYQDRVDLVILGSGDTKYIGEELLSLGYSEDKLFTNLNNTQIVAKLLSIAKTGDLILIKGSRSVKLDEVVRRVSKKTT